ALSGGSCGVAEGDAADSGFVSSQGGIAISHIDYGGLAKEPARLIDRDQSSQFDDESDRSNRSAILQAIVLLMVLLALQEVVSKHSAGHKSRSRDVNQRFRP
ncbi:MAG TPA: hypothetical protein VLE23_12635, partial [Geminicoccaceae bacterium]|nr:hypothetical protein [Geminicoccaceae bacterium]